MSEENENPYDMNGSSFDSQKYFEKLLKEASLKDILDTETTVIKETQTLHSDMQTLVYENYNKFISATDTIRKMKTDFVKMETDMNLLASKMSSITSFSGKITDTLESTKSRLKKLSEKNSLLKRLQFLSSLPNNLKKLIKEGRYSQAVQDYMETKKILQHYGKQPSFQGIQKDCEQILDELKNKLKSDFETVGTSAQSIAEIGEILLLLGEKPSNLAEEMLQYASKRLHEQIVLLQDQTERDMIEFIDLGIEGFLNEMVIVDSSYYDMFLAKEILDERDDFQDNATTQLNTFVNKSMEEYLSIVQGRVEAATKCGDTEILLRALDRLHRRLLAMKNLCPAVDLSNKTALNIIIQAVYQLCDVHSNNLKDYFSDSLSSIRLQLASSKNNGSVNLNELINTLYVSTIEKAKGVLQDLIIFVQPDWSFNIKADSQGILCIENIRENLIIGFLQYVSSTMISFCHYNASSPPNLLLILSKTCLEMEKNGVHTLVSLEKESQQYQISLTDDLYDIDSENSTTLTHETEICAEMKESGQNLLDSYVRMQGINISQMLRKSVETRDWLNCLEPRSVRAVMKRVIDELTTFENIVANLFDTGQQTTASSDSSRKTHFSNLTSSRQQFRSNWSNYTPSQLESSYVSNIHRLFSEQIEIFSPVEFSKVSILTGIIKISLKTLLECVRLQTFSKNGLQQIQVDTHYLQMNLWRFVTDENLMNFMLDEILGSAVHRCLEAVLMEPNAVEIICERG